MEQPREQYNPLKGWLALCVLICWAEQTLQWSRGKIRRSSLRSCEAVWVLVCGWGDHRQATLTSMAREWNIVVARTIRRLPASEREDSNLVVAMRGTPVAGRPADAAADHAPTVTRHAVERREVIVVPAISGAPPQAGSKTSAHLPIQFRTCPNRQLRGHHHHRLQWKAAIIQVGRELTVLVLVVTCLWRWHELWNRQRSHTLQWRSTTKVSFQRDREGDPRRTVGQVGDHPNTQLVVHAATGAAIDIC